MLHQIELYRLVPIMRENLLGFMDETRSRLADCQKTDFSLKSKYGNRLKKAETALNAVRSLQRCLDE